MRDQLTAVAKKVYRRPLYRIAMMILGLPTFLVAGILFAVNKGKHQADNVAGELKKQILRRFEEDGTKDRLYQETKSYIENKDRFFHRNTSASEMEKEVQRQFELDLDKLVQQQLEEDETYRNGYHAEKFIDYLCRNLNGNSTLAILSVISSFPAYLLLLIYSNAYSKYIFERLMMMVFVLFGVVFLVFTILYLSPLDPAVNILGQTATPDQIESFNKVYGLDRPYIVRLFENFKGLATFDLGRSYAGNEIVAEAIMRKFPVTLQLTFISLLVAVVIAVPAGIISAVKQYSAFDHTFMLLALLGLSIPNFWLGLIMILNFSIKMHWLPAIFQEGNWVTLIMPAIVLGTSLAANVARMTRSSMLEVVHQDYIVTARAKGLSRQTVTLKHALGNAMIPIVTVIGLQFGGMLGGSAVTEKVFNVNGIGSYVVDKQFVPDIPVVLASVVYVAVVISLVNLLVDILYSFLDPRIKSQMKNY